VTCGWRWIGAHFIGAADVFGSGKVLIFGHVIDKDGSPYSADIRGVLKGYADNLHEKKGYTLNASNEIPKDSFSSQNAERSTTKPANSNTSITGGYYHSLPAIRSARLSILPAEVQRAMAFQNEKDHPEVAPSQFEINYGYGEAGLRRRQIQLYKLIAARWPPHGVHRLLCRSLWIGVNGNGMPHQRFDQQGRQKSLLGSQRQEKLSKQMSRGWHC